jgi:SAM-dependent methyltransferase
LFVSLGCNVVATDLPVEEADGRWIGGSQHSETLEDIFYEQIVDRNLFLENASFQPVNMKNIPIHLNGFDFCWSSCALEHLGSLSSGIEFIKNSLNCLKPGGIAVHTTEFNLGSANETLTEGPTVVFRESDIQELSDELVKCGHKITLNLCPGHSYADTIIAKPGDSDIHLRIYAGNKVPATSIGICIEKSL